MPALKNVKHETFAQELAKGKTQAESYGRAGYKRNEFNACRLAARPDVAARVAELQSRGADRAEVTIESLILEAGEIQRSAMEAKQHSAAVAALTAKAKLAGKWIEKSEVGKPGDFDRMSEEELEAYIAERFGVDGRSRPGTGAQAGQAGVRGKPGGLH